MSDVTQILSQIEEGDGQAAEKLAIRLDEMLRSGEVTDQSQLARLSHVTQPRMTQILNLNLLAPDIQEALLTLPRVMSGKDPVTERDLRPVVAEVDWERQREMWGNLGV